MKKIQILVCAHKKDAYTRNGGIYKAIQVGKALRPELDLGYQCDNTGDNISEKNSKYCEWTALYWGWKNLKDAEYLGLAHYRRYFDIEITEDNIDSVMQDFDILVTNPRISMPNAFQSLVDCISIDNAFLFVDSLLSIYPNYKKVAVDYLLNSNEIIQCSMFIAKKEIYDEFCNFAFPVLLDYERRIRDSGYFRMNRSVGYVGEMLLGLFIRARCLKVRFVPMKTEGGATQHRYSLKYKLKMKLVSLLQNRKHTDFVIWPEVQVGFKIDGIKLKYFKNL